MKYKQLLKELEDLRNRKVFIYNLMIADEIECQIEKELTDAELDEIMQIVENCYLKTTDVTIEELVRFILQNDLKDIRKMSSWEIIEASLN